MWNSKPFVIFFSVIAAVSVLFLLFSYRTVQLNDHLLRNGVQTMGKVVGHDVRTGNRGYGQNHYFVYRFLDAEARYYEGQVIRSEPDNRLKVGKEIEIIYDRRDPRRNSPSIMLPDNIYQPIYSSLKFAAAAMGVTFAFGAFMFSKFARKRLCWASLKRLFGVAVR